MLSQAPPFSVKKINGLIVFFLIRDAKVYIKTEIRKLVSNYLHKLTILLIKISFSIKFGELSYAKGVTGELQNSGIET